MNMLPCKRRSTLEPSKNKKRTQSDLIGHKITPDKIPQSSVGDKSEASENKSNHYLNNYLLVERGRALEMSETNIYMDPEEPKSARVRKRRFKTVHHANDKGLYYQEINSDGNSIGGKLSHVPKDSDQLSGKMSKHSNH